MKALLAAIAVVAALPITAHAEFQAPHRKVDWKLGTSHKVAKAPAHATLAAKEEADAEGPTLSVDEVMTKINHVYMTGLQRCYNRSLKSDPTISGKVTLLFTVDVKGRVLSDLDGIAPSFDKCLTGMISGWRFPHVSEPAEATFKISLVLRQ
jgi:hypothetical protein